MKCKGTVALAMIWEKRLLAWELGARAKSFRECA